MADEEYTVIEILDVLRRQAARDNISAIARSTGMDRKTVRKYIRIAEGKGLMAAAESEIEDVAYAVFREIHSNYNGGDGNTRDAILLPHKDVIGDWLKREDLTLTKVHMKLLRSGVETSYSSLYRFMQEHIGMPGNHGTVRMAETEPGEVAEVDFGRLRYLFDKAVNRLRALYALVVTLVFSRYQYVHLTRKQVMFSSHSWPRFGNARNQEVMRTQRDAYANLNNEVLHQANKGVTINEIHNVYKLPKSLQEQWAARSYHGSEEHNSRAVINRYLGYWDANPATLIPLSPRDSAPLYVEMMGGASKIMAKGKELADQGKYREAVEILNKLFFAEPNNQAA